MKGNTDGVRYTPFVTYKKAYIIIHKTRTFFIFEQDMFRSIFDPRQLQMSYKEVTKFIYNKVISTITNANINKKLKKNLN